MAPLFQGSAKFWWAVVATLPPLAQCAPLIRMEQIMVKDGATVIVNGIWSMTMCNAIWSMPAFQRVRFLRIPISIPYFESNKPLLKDYRVGPWKVGCKQTDIYKVAIGVMGGVIMLLIGIIVYTITHGMRKPGEVKHAYYLIQMQKYSHFHLSCFAAWQPCQ